MPFNTTRHGAGLGPECLADRIDRVGPRCCAARLVPQIRLVVQHSAPTIRKGVSGGAQCAVATA
eukprot:10496122-Alexandrium_andersonii.AAC.1